MSHEKETDVNKGALVLQSVVVNIKIKIPAAMDIVLFTTSSVSQYWNKIGKTAWRCSEGLGRRVFVQTLLYVIKTYTAACIKSTKV